MNELMIILISIITYFSFEWLSIIYIRVCSNVTHGAHDKHIQVVYYNRFVLVQCRMGIQYCNMIEFWILFHFHTTWILFYVINHLQVSIFYFFQMFTNIYCNLQVHASRLRNVNTKTCNNISLHNRYDFPKVIMCFLLNNMFLQRFWSTRSFTATHKALYNLYKDCDVNFTSLYMF